MRKTVPFISGVMFALAVLAGCPADTAKREDSLIIMSWNLQALFDGTDTGTEYADYRESAGWNGEKYRGRLNAVVEAVKTVQPGVLGLLEVENAAAVKEIAAALDYRSSFFASAPRSSLGVALLSRFPITKTKTHSVRFSKNAAPRPIAEVWLDADGETLIILVCHWKSKLGGEKATEAVRRSEAAALARRLAELNAEAPDAPVIVMGDLNENHDEFERTGYPCALMPDTAQAARTMQAAQTTARAAAGKAGGIRPGFQDFLALSGAKPPRTEHLAAPNVAAVLYSPWLDAPHDENGAVLQGSFHYREHWETIDHVLLNGAAFDGRGWDFAGFRPAAQAPFINGKGLPAAYVPKTGNGLSDHLPVLVTLERARE